MKHLTYFLIIFSTCLIYSCDDYNQSETKSNQTSILEDSEISFKEKVIYVLENGLKKKLNINQSQINNLYQFYQDSTTRGFFVSDTGRTAVGKEFKGFMDNPLKFGICKSRLLSIPESSHWIEKEVIDVINMCTVLGDLEYGYLDFDSSTFKPIHEVNFTSNSLDSMIQSNSYSIQNHFLQKGPVDTNFRYLAKNIFEYCEKYPLDTNTYSLKSKKEDPVNFERNINKALQTKGYLVDSSERGIKKAILAFKKDCGYENSTIITNAVLEALSESTENKLIRAAISLDKWRQGAKKEKKHIRVNLPSFKLYFVAEAKLQSEHRVIIGKYKTQTPEFSAKIDRVVSYPYWKVPHSISDNEILPSVRRKKSYLADNHYRIYKNDVEVNPDSVDFTKFRKIFPFTTIQDPGKHNSLGILKIVFYNEHGVYVHDTPTKSLFKRDFRSFSHGCMRCEKPIELAKKILDFDSISPRNRNEIDRDSLDLFIKNEEHRVIKLKKRIPIYIEYITVTSDENQLYFHNDLYAREQKLIKLF